MQFNQKSSGKAMSYSVVCGPFTINNELSYEALKDVVALVQKDKPHALIIGGPFVSVQNEQVSSGDLRYRLPNGELKFLDYQGLLNEIMSYINDRIPASTQLIVVPSTNEI